MIYQFINGQRTSDIEAPRNVKHGTHDFYRVPARGRSVWRWATHNNSSYGVILSFNILQNQLPNSTATVCDFHRFSTAVMSLLHSTHPNAGAVPKIPWIPPRVWAWGKVTSCIHLPRFQVVQTRTILNSYVYPEFRYEIKSKPIVLKHTWAAQKKQLCRPFFTGWLRNGFPEWTLDCDCLQNSGTIP
jgi:hypothetical protein